MRRFSFTAFCPSGVSKRGCLPGIDEILRRQGIFETTACLDPHEQLSPGQAAELDRIIACYPWLIDDAFVAEHLHRWLA
ncbi:MAG TPA: hypothetical protein VFT72_08625 [Opitutaceae bacterium]|nr:hypothetical protein [Opitutaceae bacterium]